MGILKTLDCYFNICNGNNCCKTGSVPSPCQNAPEQGPVLDYIRSLKNTTLYASTITIGNKRYGSLSAEEQYKEMKKEIKKHVKYHDPELFYYYEFEYQKNGQVHAHGITNIYQNRFELFMGQFGARNYHKDSFQEVKHLEDYIKYITKERAFPPVHNITKRRRQRQPQGGDLTEVK